MNQDRLYWDNVKTRLGVYNRTGYTSTVETSLFNELEFDGNLLFKTHTAITKNLLLCIK